MAALSRATAAVSQTKISLCENNFGAAVLMEDCSTSSADAATVRSSTEPQSGQLLAWAGTRA
jgi:hypothetical protein